MLAHKHITKIAAIIMTAVVCLCVIAMIFVEDISAALGAEGVTMEYETALFDTGEVMTVNILMDGDEWQEMLDNAAAEVYYQCDVEINGKTYYRVGIRPKGNTSLSSIAADSTTDRYSFKLEFDQFVEGQTCYGLDKLILNNNYADATNMKEALIYDMYTYLDADASLYNYARISVNGEYWGVYLALEAVEDSFLLRNYGAESGELYKPDSMNIGGAMGGGRGEMDFGDMDFGDMDFGDMDFGGMDFGDMDFGGMDFGDIGSDFSSLGNAGGSSAADGGKPDMSEMPDMGEMPDMSGMPDMGEMPEMSGMPERGEGFDRGDFSMGGFSMGGSGANLNYSDDDLDSYSTIWDGEVTKTSDADHKRVVTALKNISEGTDLDTYMDIDNLLKYMAVHLFSVNDDSLSGSMAHNYYLYEENGALNIIPWDYNLAFGGMGMSGMGSGDEATNVVNEPIDDAFSATNFFDTLMESEEYHAAYYAVMSKLVDEYLLGDGFENFYQRTRAQIDQLVETDPNALYTYKEYLTAVETLYELVKLRGQSINGQLAGTIPSVASEQRNSEALIDASHLDVSVLGSMSMGGGAGGFGGFGERGESGRGPEQGDAVIGTSDKVSDESPTESAPGNEFPFDRNNMSENISENISENMPENMLGNMPDSRPGFSSGRGGTQTDASNLMMLAVCIAILIIALLAVKGYKRKPFRR